MEHQMNESCRIRFENHESRLTSQEKKTENYGVMEERIKNIDKNVDRIDKKLDEILNKPSKLWDIVIATLIGGGVTFLITHFLK